MDITYNANATQSLDMISSYFVTYPLDVVRIAYYHLSMIKSFRDKRTEEFNAGNRIKEFQSFSKQAEKRLRILDAADKKEDLMLLPSNRFKALEGDRQAQFSIRINDQWRICFEWDSGQDGPENVEITDYH